MIFHVASGFAFAGLIYVLARHENNKQVRRKLLRSLPRPRAAKATYFGEVGEFLRHFCDLLNIKFVNPGQKTTEPVEKIKMGIWFEFHYLWAISELSLNALAGAPLTVSVFTEDKSLEVKSWEEKLSLALGKQIRVKINQMTNGV
jgi:hypothetical protein